MWCWWWWWWWVVVVVVVVVGVSSSSRCEHASAHFSRVFVQAGGYFRLVCDSEDNVGGTGDFGLYYHGDDPTCSLTAGIVPLNGWYGYKRCYEDPATGAFLKPMGCSTAEPHIETLITKESCFPAHATVTLADKSSKRMDELELGDRVHVGGGEFSEVFHFTTLLEDTTSKFVKLTIQNRSLILSHEHYLYVDGRLTQAQHAKIGDSVTLSDGSRAPIQSVGEEWYCNHVCSCLVAAPVVVAAAAAWCLFVAASAC